MLNNTLWTERYRPETIEDYVWINDGQRQQVESWIKEGDLPHLLLSGGPGVGKCLGPDENIVIRLNVNNLTDEQKTILRIK